MRSVGNARVGREREAAGADIAKRKQTDRNSNVCKEIIVNWQKTPKVYRSISVEIRAKKSSGRPRMLRSNILKGFRVDLYPAGGRLR